MLNAAAAVSAGTGLSRGGIPGLFFYTPHRQE